MMAKLIELIYYAGSWISAAFSQLKKASLSMQMDQTFGIPL